MACGRRGRRCYDAVMGQFMLLLYDRPGDWLGVPPERLERLIAEYSAWVERMQEAGRLVLAEKLKDEGGKVLGRDGAVAHPDYAAAEEVLGGIFVVRAADYEEAVQLARSSPHARYGARTEVREIQVLG